MAAVAGPSCFAQVRDTVLNFVFSKAPIAPAVHVKVVDWVFCFAAFYGLFLVLRFLATVVRGFIVTYLRPGRSLQKLGGWAVVTGATDGIGKAYCFEFARKGMNVVLISRTPSKLDAVAKEITDKYPKVETKTIAVDFSDFTDSLQAKVAAELGELSVGVLVNNVGTAFSYPEYFIEMPVETSSRLVEINVQSVIKMTHIVLPGMLERRRGAILNLSSGTSLIPGVLQSTYGGTKAFVNAFSESLAGECRKNGVHIQCVQPLFVTSKLSKIRRSSLFVPSEKTFVRASVAAIGYENCTIPYGPHAFQMWLATSLPRWVQESYIMKLHSSLRRRALKKKAAKAAEGKNQ